MKAADLIRILKKVARDTEILIEEKKIVKIERKFTQDHKQQLSIIPE